MYTLGADILIMVYSFLIFAGDQLDKDMQIIKFGKKLFKIQIEDSYPVCNSIRLYQSAAATKPGHALVVKLGTFPLHQRELRGGNEIVFSNLGPTSLYSLVLEDLGADCGLREHRDTQGLLTKH